MAQSELDCKQCKNEQKDEAMDQTFESQKTESFCSFLHCLQSSSDCAIVDI